MRRQYGHSWGSLIPAEDGAGSLSWVLLCCDDVDEVGEMTPLWEPKWGGKY